MKHIKKHKKINVGLVISTYVCESIADTAKDLNDAFIKKGFTTEQAFQLTAMVIRHRLG